MGLIPIDGPVQASVGLLAGRIDVMTDTESARGSMVDDDDDDNDDKATRCFFDVGMGCVRG